MGNLNLNVMLETLNSCEQTCFGTPNEDEILDFKSTFRLASPGADAVKLVQYAIAIGATKIKVTSTLTRLQIVFDGPPTTAEILADLLPRLLKPKIFAVRDPLCHLAAGLCAASQEEPKQITFDSLSSGIAYRHVWDPDGLHQVVSSELIPKDTTGFQILKETDFKLQMLWLLEQARKLAEELDFNDSKFPSALQRRIASALERTVKRDIT